MRPAARSSTGQSSAVPMLLRVLSAMKLTPLMRWCVTISEAQELSLGIEKAGQEKLSGS